MVVTFKTNTARDSRILRSMAFIVDFDFMLKTKNYVAIVFCILYV